MMGSTVSVAATGAATIAINTCEVYTFTTAKKQLRIQNHPGAAGNLYVWINADASDAANWEFVLEPGRPIVVGGEDGNGQDIRKVAVFADYAATYGTHFSIKGLP